MQIPAQIAPVNRAPLGYFHLRKYSQENVDNVCAEADATLMAARITLNGTGAAQITVTNRTWERQEGHYPTIVRFFSQVAKHPVCLTKSGSFIVWLEDGLWEKHQGYSQAAPTLAFGRHNCDSSTFLIPDPAFLGAEGYQEELKEISLWERERTHQKIKTIFWRGAATGVGIGKVSWESTPRARLTLLAKELNNREILDAKFTKVGHLQPERQQLFKELELLSEQCEFREFLKYLFLIEADGYCCAWRAFFLKLATESVVLKIQSNFEQWFYRDLVPWVHYIPVNSDLSGLVELHGWLARNTKNLETIVSQAHDVLRRFTISRALDETSMLVSQILDCQQP